MEGALNEARQREKAEAEAVLGSELFLRAPNPHRILSFICELYFAGKVEWIKEYNIGVEALGRGSDFDPARDTIVRVEASRLRKRLLEYYSGPGADHELRLVLPHSGYVPQFLPRQPEESATPAAPEVPVRVRQYWKRFAVGLALAVLLALGWSLWHRSGGTSNPATLPAPPRFAEPIRILPGYLHPEYVDSLGRKWLGDRYFTGGRPFQSVGGDIQGVLDPTLYRCARVGNFRYDIPLARGVYELHLLFAETVWGKGNRMYNGEATRMFRILVNHRPLLQDFDIITQAGAADTPADRYFKDVTPDADGSLHLEFQPVADEPLLNGIEVLPSTPGRLRPIRILAAGQSFTDRSQATWEGDRYFIGGQPKTWLVTVKNTPDPEVYRSERWGRFSYAIPVDPDSHYTITLKFAESYFGPDTRVGGGIGSRVFDVYCNGTTLLQHFDVFAAAAGQNRAVDRIFHGVKPTAQGQLLLSFIPAGNFASIRAIEVLDEGR